MVSNNKIGGSSGLNGMTISEESKIAGLYIYILTPLS